MRNVTVQEFEAHPADFISEVEAGTRLTLIRGGKAVIQINPVESKPEPESDREQAAERLIRLMESGVDLEGAHIKDRDALYERESLHG